MKKNKKFKTDLITPFMLLLLSQAKNVASSAEFHTLVDSGRQNKSVKEIFKRGDQEQILEENLGTTLPINQNSS